jgi:hypothetical protein
LSSYRRSAWRGFNDVPRPVDAACTWWCRAWRACTPGSLCAPGLCAHCGASSRWDDGQAVPEGFPGSLCRDDAWPTPCFWVGHPPGEAAGNGRQAGQALWRSFRSAWTDKGVLTVILEALGAPCRDAGAYAASSALQGGWGKSRSRTGGTATGGESARGRQQAASEARCRQLASCVLLRWRRPDEGRSGGWPKQRSGGTQARQVAAALRTSPVWRDGIQRTPSCMSNDDWARRAALNLHNLSFTAGKRDKRCNSQRCWGWQDATTAWGGQKTGSPGKNHAAVRALIKDCFLLICSPIHRLFVRGHHAVTGLNLLGSKPWRAWCSAPLDFTPVVPPGDGLRSFELLDASVMMSYTATFSLDVFFWLLGWVGSSQGGSQRSIKLCVVRSLKLNSIQNHSESVHEQILSLRPRTERLALTSRWSASYYSNSNKAEVHVTCWTK